VGHLEGVREMRNAYILVGRYLDGSDQLRQTRSWEDNIKMDLMEIRCEGTEWIHVTYDGDQWQSLLNAIMNFWVPWKVGNSLTS